MPSPACVLPSLSLDNRQTEIQFRKPHVNFFFDNEICLDRHNQREIYIVKHRKNKLELAAEEFK